MPEEYDEFCDVVQAYGVRRQRLVLQRMVKCNHAALDNGASRARLEKLFAFLVLYVHDVADSKQLPMVGRRRLRLPPDLICFSSFLLCVQVNLVCWVHLVFT